MASGGSCGDGGGGVGVVLVAPVSLNGPTIESVEVELTGGMPRHSDDDDNEGVLRADIGRRGATVYGDVGGVGAGVSANTKVVGRGIE